MTERKWDYDKRKGWNYWATDEGDAIWLGDDPIETDEGGKTLTPDLDWIIREQLPVASREEMEDSLAKHAAFLGFLTTHEQSSEEEQSSDDYPKAA